MAVQIQMTSDEYTARLERRLARLTVENEALHEELAKRLAAEQADATETDEPEKPVRLKRPRLARLPDEESTSGA